MKLLQWFDENFEILILSAALVLMVVIMSAQVFMRKVMGSSLSWSEEIARYLFIWSGFLSISLTLRNNTAIKVEMLTSALPDFFKNITSLLSQLLMLVLFIFMIKVSVDIVLTIDQQSTTLGISMKWIYAAATAGFTLTALRLIQGIALTLRSMTGKNMNKQGGAQVDR